MRVERSFEEALKWFREAAKFSTSVALRYYKGEGVQFYVEVVKWFREVAGQNHLDVRELLERLDRGVASPH